MRIGITKGEILLLDGNIVKVELADDTHLQPQDLREIDRIGLKLGAGEKCGILIVSGAGSTISKETLELMCDAHDTKDYAPKAVIVNKLAQRYLESFFEEHNLEKFPVAAFNSKAKATKWLKEMLR